MILLYKLLGKIIYIFLSFSYSSADDIIILYIVVLVLCTVNLKKIVRNRKQRTVVYTYTKGVPFIDPFFLFVVPCRGLNLRYRHNHFIKILLATFLYYFSTCTKLLVMALTHAQCTVDGVVKHNRQHVTIALSPQCLYVH
ncbi:unnamed protein product [Phytomonas sp. Hart1]|nr:unnamed protein product [Phytomonas sp. Hart1]|eukprot:CCW70867.1 unnamed protein product [Phytomonas sp. isolate Hart1]